MTKGISLKVVFAVVKIVLPPQGKQTVRSKSSKLYTLRLIDGLSEREQQESTTPSRGRAPPPDDGNSFRRSLSGMSLFRSLYTGMGLSGLYSRQSMTGIFSGLPSRRYKGTTTEPGTAVPRAYGVGLTAWLNGRTTWLMSGSWECHQGHAIRYEVSSTEDITVIRRSAIRYVLLLT